MSESKRTLTDDDVEAIAKAISETTVEAALQKTFETFGFNVATPEGRLQAAAVFRTLIFWHSFWGWILRPVFTVGGTLLGGWLIWKLFGWTGVPK